MDKKTFLDEKKYLIEVENNISSKINTLENFLLTEKQDIQELKYDLRNNHSTKSDIDDEFLDIYMRDLDFQAKKDELIKLNKMKDVPYFARVDVIEDNGESYYNYIGYRSLLKPDNSFYIIDWRAPFASLFYDFDKGDFSYKINQKNIKGKITNKRQYKISNGNLIYYFDADLKVDDELLQETLSQKTSEKMRNIVSSIQREQNKIIRYSEKNDLVVLGGAGSGKTSIALHRIAYLLYKLKGKLKSSDVLILSPNEMFASYISDVLPELNENNVINTTFEQIIKNELDNKFDFETKQEQVERMIIKKINSEIILKNSFNFLVDLYNFMIKYCGNNFIVNDIKIGPLIIPKNKIYGMYFKSYINYLPFKRIELIVESLIDEYFAKYDKLKFKIADFLKAKLYRMFLNNNPLIIYNLFLKQNNFKLTLVKNKIKHEDIIAILFVKYFMYGSLNYDAYKHLVIDEAQDYNAIQFFLIDVFFHCSKTIVGDVEQGVNVKVSNNVINNLDKILTIAKQNYSNLLNNEIKSSEISKLKISKSYRSSYEITTFCNSILGRTDCEPIKRVSEEPQLIKIDSKEKLIKVLNKLFEKYNIKEYNNIGIITKNDSYAKSLYKNIVTYFPNIKLAIDTNNHINGITILSAFKSKGLEFDAVIMYNVNDDLYNNDLDKQLLYIASSRALHNLTLIYTKKPTKFIKSYFNNLEGK